MLKECIQILMKRENLTASQCHGAMKEILNNKYPAQTAAFMALLHSKGETTEEILSILEVMRDSMKKLQIDEELIDIVGTGGDCANTINISTAASILVASCSVKVAKHGNRSVSSKCGSADLIEGLGINIALPEERIKESLHKVGIVFCYAPLFHPAMNKLKEIRKELGVMTTFNLLGPLLNPAAAKYYLLGVSEKKFMSLIAKTLSELDICKAFVVHSCGLDELSCLGPSEVIEVTSKKTKHFQIDPKDYGFSYCNLKDIQGGDLEKNRALLLSAFNGEEGPIADTIILNAAVALYIVGKVQTIEEGIELSRKKLKEGEALKTIEKWASFS